MKEENESKFWAGTIFKIYNTKDKKVKCNIFGPIKGWSC